MSITTTFLSFFASMEEHFSKETYTTLEPCASKRNIDVVQKQTEQNLNVSFSHSDSSDDKDFNIEKVVQMQLEKESDVCTLFNNEKEKENENQQTNIITNEQSLTSQLHTSSENENEVNVKNKRKRKRKSSDDIFKNRASKDKILPVNCSCMTCNEINEKSRIDNHTEFWSLSYDNQRMWISQTIELKVP